MSSARAADGGCEVDAPDAVEDGLPSLCRGELGVAPLLRVESDAPNVFAHLRRKPHPFRRTQTPKNRELGSPSIVVGIGRKHPHRV